MYISAILLVPVLEHQYFLQNDQRHGDGNNRSHPVTEIDMGNMSGVIIRRNPESGVISERFPGSIESGIQSACAC